MIKINFPRTSIYQIEWRHPFKNEPIEGSKKTVRDSHIWFREDVLTDQYHTSSKLYIDGVYQGTILELWGRTLDLKVAKTTGTWFTVDRTSAGEASTYSYEITYDMPRSAHLQGDAVDISSDVLDAMSYASETMLVGRPRSHGVTELDVTREQMRQIEEAAELHLRNYENETLQSMIGPQETPAHSFTAMAVENGAEDWVITALRAMEGLE